VSVVGVELREPTAPTSVPPARSWDLTRIMLAVLGIGGLIVASLWVVRPFAPSVIWATMIVVATWPMLRALQARLWGKRALAVAVMTVAMLVILAVPLALATVTIVDRTDDVVAWVRATVSKPLPPLPGWVAKGPIGKKAAAEWDKLARAPSEELAARVTPHVRDIARWMLAQAGSVAALLVQFLLTVAIAGILYAKGEAALAGVLAFARRLAGDHGERVVVLSGGAIRAVALGIVVTALVQAVLAGVGLAVTGVPRPVLLTGVMIMLGVAQIGPAPVLIGAIVWLFSTGAVYWGVVLIGWSLVVLSLDNVLRPLLIKRGADLPLLLIIAGVLGGLLAFGLVGLFVGPVILAVAYTLLVAWVANGEPTAVAAGARAER
jgi:predicted PurR-regulated permease PerM